MVSVVEDPMAGFLYALRSPISKKKYPQRLRVLRFLGFNGKFKDDALEFLKKASEDPDWVKDMLMRFISSQIERLNRGEIAAASGKTPHRESWGERVTCSSAFVN